MELDHMKYKNKVRKINKYERKNIVKNEIEEDEKKLAYLTRIAGIP